MCVRESFLQIIFINQENIMAEFKIDDKVIRTGISKDKIVQNYIYNI